MKKKEKKSDAKVKKKKKKRNAARGKGLKLRNHLQHLVRKNNADKRNAARGKGLKLRNHLQQRQLQKIETPTIIKIEFVILVFFTCAVCALEEGIKTMHFLTPDLKSSVDDVMSPFWILFVRDFPVDVVSTLEQPGFLVGANHICNECLKLLKSTVVPKRALVTGFCCGSVPHVLSILNRTEIS